MGQPENLEAEPAASELLLTDLEALRRRTRRARQRDAWLPLALFGLVLVLADRVARLDPRVRLVEVPGSGGGSRLPKDQWLANLAGSPPHLPLSIYWLIALPAAFGLSAVWLRRQSRQRGVEQRWAALAAAGLLPFAALLALRLLVEPHVRAVHAALSHESPSQYLQPLLCIGLGLLALAVLEQSRALLLTCGTLVAVDAAGFLVVANGVRTGSWQAQLTEALTTYTAAAAGVPLLLSGLLLLGLAAAWAARAGGTPTRP